MAKLQMLKMETTETFSFDPDKIEQTFAREWEFTLMSALTKEPKPTREQVWQDFVIEMFEWHNGSQFGDEVFSSRADWDVGYELGSDPDA